MHHPARVVTREMRTRRPKRPGRELAELEAATWPEKTLSVRDVMTRPALTVRQDATVGVAWKLMRTRKVRHVPVLDAASRLVGILSDRDLRQVILEPSIQEQLGNLARAFVCPVAAPVSWPLPSAAVACSELSVWFSLREKAIT